MLCRIKLFSNVHRTEIVLVMGRELTMGVSSTKLDRQQQNCMFYWSSTVTSEC